MRLSIKNRTCPLCGATDADEFYQDKYRDYFRCSVCSLVFVPSEQYLAKDKERAQYDSHQNSPDDPRYRQFLSRLFIPLEKRLTRGSCGLDFGSGPGPTLSVMFEEAGHNVSLYDAFYAPDISVFNKKYDFVATSEVVEHLNNPKDELNRLWNCLKPQGYLGIMTKRVIDREAFAGWHYKNEPTHICFYSKETFCWLAGLWNAEATFADNDVVIFSKGQNYLTILTGGKMDNTTGGGIRWGEETRKQFEQLIEKIPVFLRGMAREKVSKRAQSIVRDDSRTVRRVFH